jgi:hypothetical protein
MYLNPIWACPFHYLGLYCLSCLSISTILRAFYLLKLFWKRYYSAHHSSHFLGTIHVFSQNLIWVPSRSCAMLKMDRNCCLNGVLPTHVFSQNLIWVPSLILKNPQDNTSSLIFINPLQKWESYDLTCTWVSAFEWRYLFLSKFC